MHDPSWVKYEAKTSNFFLATRFFLNDESLRTFFFYDQKPEFFFFERRKSTNIFFTIKNQNFFNFFFYELRDIYHWLILKFYIEWIVIMQNFWERVPQCDMICHVFSNSPCAPDTVLRPTNKWTVTLRYFSLLEARHKSIYRTIAPHLQIKVKYAPKGKYT